MSVVGIDLGTTNTVVACVRQGKVHVLADEHGQRLLPSVVSFHPNGEVLVGGSAKARRVIDPRNTVYSHKRLIGRSWGSPEIVQAKQRFAFELREGPGQGPLVHARGQDYTLPEISAFVLKRARQIAEAALGTAVERAVITVPAHFNELQRASTKVAGRVSGLEVLRILNEPTAAALAYGLGRTGNERVAVYDFGGGTFDCTLLDLNGNVFEVLATAGDSFLGGDDVDNLIAERMAETYLKAHRYDPRSDPQMFERLKTTAEDMKVALSGAETHTVVLKEFGFGAGGSSINYTFTMTRRDLDAMITPLVDRTFKVTQDALSLARLTPTSFDKVILVGGSTRIPIVRKRVEAFFGAPPMDRVNPDEVVAIGAAIQAAALTEGAKRRSIPAPPPVMGGTPATQRGLQNDLDDTAATQRGRMGLPPGGPSSGGPQTRSGPPPTGAPTGGRKITSPGVAPATQPLGQRASAPTAPGQDDDPSIASFPDLQVPTPFEWFPSGHPSSGGAQGKNAVSERSFGGNTITKAGQEPAADPNTMTAAMAPRPGNEGPGFGAIDEPPSLYSTPSASVPSFPSMTSGQGGMPSPIGEPEPFGGDAAGGKFGTVRDLSLVSSSGLGTAPGVGRESDPGNFGAVKDLSLISSSGMETNPGVSSDKGPFGHVSDLSLISTNTETAAMEAITHARQQALGQTDFDDSVETEVRSEAADLPAVVERADLPAVSAKKKPATPQRPGQALLGKQAQPSGSVMLGKPPPAVAPQPFGPMAKVDEPPAGPMSRTGVMPGRPPVPPSPGAIPAKARSGGQRPAPASPPLDQTQIPRTAPMPQVGQRPAPPPVPQPSPVAKTQMSAQSPLSPSELPRQHPSGFPRQGPQVVGFSNAPPAPAPAPYPSAPPPAPIPPTMQAQAYPSAPPGAAFGAPPQYGAGSVGGSQPPIFGSFSSAPPEADPQGVGAFGSGGYEQVPPAPQAPSNLGFAAPVLVDVTPRALIVETAGGYTDTIIPRNSKIPCERTRRFATGRDMQTTVRVRVAQGEHAYFPQNTYLGEVELSGLRPAPRGEVVVAVTFEVDADGTMRVRARDVQTGQEARATLQLVGVADESSVVMMINRFAQQPVSGGGGGGPPGAPPGYPI